MIEGVNLENEHVIAVEIGKRIVLERKRHHFSQVQLAEGICSQSMISSIEKGLYIPNAVLLGRICQKLNVSMGSIVLSHYLEIEGETSFNKTIKQLCDQHNYSEMLNYLNDSKILAQLSHDKDLQTYYYYYGVAIYQVNNNSKKGLLYLNMALNYTFSPHRDVFTSTELLITSVIAFLETEKKSTVKSGFEKLQHVLVQIEARPQESYSENLNICFYLYAFSLLNKNNYELANKVANLGISWITKHKSVYMLADLFFLLAKIYSASMNDNDACDALEKSRIIESLYDIDTYKF